MATIRYAFTTNITAGNLSKLQGTWKIDALNRLINLVAACVSSSGQATPGQVAVTIDEDTTYAAGTITCATVANNSTVTIGNIVLTGKTVSPSGQAQWLCGVSASADAIALKNCINANTSLSPFVLASVLGAVVTITAIGPASGLLGNFLILSSSDNTNLARVAFASGAADPNAKTYGF